MANFIPKLWTDSHGAIHRPDPGSSLLCFSRPVLRFALVSATSAASASMVPRSRFRTLIFKMILVITRFARPCCGSGDFLGKGGLLEVILSTAAFHQESGV